MGRRLRERKPRTVKVIGPKVDEPEDFEEDDDEETDEKSSVELEEESEGESQEESEDESQEEEQEELPKQSKGRGRGRGQSTKDSKPPKRKSRSIDKTNLTKKRRLAASAGERAARRDAELAAQQVVLLQAQVEQLQQRVGSEQQPTYRATPGFLEPRRQATHNTTQSAVLRFAAQNLRADAIEELAATLEGMPHPVVIDNPLAHVQTPGTLQGSEEVD